MLATDLADDPADVLAATIRRTEHTITGVLAAASAGDPGIQRLIAATGEPGPTSLALSELRERAPAIEQSLGRRT